MTENEVTAEQEGAGENKEEAITEETAVAEENQEEPSPEETPVAEEKPAAKKATKKAKTEEAADEAPAPAPKAAKAKAAPATDSILETIKNMTVLELAELVKTLEAEFGVTAAAPVVVGAAAPADAGAAAEPEEEKTEFNVILSAVGDNKISVIRAVRELTSLGLKESKDLVESAPKPVKEGINKDEATAAKQKLEEAGATADIT